MKLRSHYDTSLVFAFPSEIWLEIFKHIDVLNLVKLSQVCRSWNQLIFQYMGDRIRIRLDTERGHIPQRLTGMAPDRKYKHLHLRAYRLGSPNKLMKIFEKLAPNLESLKLTLQSFNLFDLMHMLTRCPRLCELYIRGIHLELDSFDFMELLKVAARIINAETSLDLESKLEIFDKTTQSCILMLSELPMSDNSRPIFPALQSLGLDITYPNQFGAEILPCFSNLTELEFVAHHQEVNVIERLAPQLKVLKVKVFNDAVQNFLALRMPALEMLVLKLNSSYADEDLKQFLLGSQKLKTVMFTSSEYRDVFPPLAHGLPFVERLQVSGETNTCLGDLQRMKNLKELALKGCQLEMIDVFSFEIYSSVQKLECIGVMFNDPVGIIIDRFPNVQSLSLSVRDIYDMSYFATSVWNVRELTMYIDQVNVNIIRELEGLQFLQKLLIKATVFRRTTFYKLKSIIAQPALKSLVVIIEKGTIPLSVAGKVALENRNCMFILNGKRVEPLETARAARPKRKQSK